MQVQTKTDSGKARFDWLFLWQPVPFATALSRGMRQSFTLGMIHLGFDPPMNSIDTYTLTKFAQYLKKH